MKNNSGTSTVEDVGSREQGSTKTQGETRTENREPTRKPTRKKKHTKKNQQDVNSNNDRLNQQKQSESYKEGREPGSPANLANGQRRTGQWNMTMAQLHGPHQKVQQAMNQQEEQGKKLQEQCSQKMPEIGICP